jgi:tetratricopeptide (TPR) repeat protein
LDAIPKHSWNNPQSLPLSPRDPHAYYARSEAYVKLSKYEQAAQDVSESIRLEPHFALAFYSRGLIRLKQRNIEQAIDDFTQALRLGWDPVEVYIARAEAFCHARDYQKAKNDLTDAAAKAPANWTVSHQLAWLLAACPDQALRDGDKALALAKKACEASGWKAALPLYSLAAALAEKGDYNGAVKWHKKAMEIGFANRGHERWAQDVLAVYESGKPLRDDRE